MTSPGQTDSNSHLYSSHDRPLRQEEFPDRAACGATSPHPFGAIRAAKSCVARRSASPSGDGILRGRPFNRPPIGPSVSLPRSGGRRRSRFAQRGRKERRVMGPTRARSASASFPGRVADSAVRRRRSRGSVPPLSACRSTPAGRSAQPPGKPSPREAIRRVSVWRPTPRPRRVGSPRP